MENHREEKGGSRLVKKEKPPKKPSRFTKQEKILIAAVIVLAVALAGVLALKSLFVRPDLSNRKPGVSAIGSGGGEVEEPEEIDYGEGVRPKKDGARKSEDYYTVLVLGRDTGGGGNTDTILLGSYDVTNQKATVMSIPRDTMVNVPWDIKKINSVYNYYGTGDKGIQHLYKEISQLVGFEPDYQVVVEWDGVGEIVNAMGGVWFDVPRDMNYDDPTQDLHIHQKKGYRLLDGDDAMQVIRYRHDNDTRYGYPDADLGRIRTQQAFLTAMIEQLLQWKNVTRLYQFITVFQNNVETDMPFQTVLWFAQKAAGGLSVSDISFVTMPNTGVMVYSPSISRQIGRNNWQSYVVPNARSLLELVNNDLSPFVEKFTMSDLDIMSKNADGSLSSSTGYVEDRKAASPPVLVFPEGDEEDPEVDEDGNPIDPETGLPIIDPDAQEPGGSEPGVTGPGILGPGTTTPGNTDPGTANPADPGTTGSPGTGANDPDVDEPSGGEPGDPVVDEPPQPFGEGGFVVIEPPPEPFA